MADQVVACNASTITYREFKWPRARATFRLHFALRAPATQELILLDSGRTTFCRGGMSWAEVITSSGRFRPFQTVSGRYDRYKMYTYT